MDEALLALEQRPALLGALFCDALGLDAPARMPDHRQEHRRHQRHLEELPPQLNSAECIEADRQRRHPHHEPEHDERSPHRPHPEAVQEREADPDEVKRDRLPARPREHRHVVQGSERDP